jgi:hypothetical protein
MSWTADMDHHKRVWFENERNQEANSFGCNLSTSPRPLIWTAVSAHMEVSIKNFDVANAGEE